MITYTKSDYADLYQLTEETKRAVEKLWRSKAPRGFADMITGGGAFRWLRDKLTYFDAKAGRALTQREVRMVVDAFADNVEGEADAIYDMLSPNNDDWQQQATELFIMTHRAAGIVALGGLLNITQADVRALGEALEFQLDKLQNFAKQVRDGLIKTPWLRRRLRYYVNTSRHTFENQRRRLAKIVYTEERRVLHAKESCSDCIDYAAKGWQPIGTLPPLGDSECMANCRCTFEFR